MLSIFEFESQEIRFIDDKPVAIDVAKILGYANPTNAVKRHVFENNKTTSVSDVVNKNITVLHEAGIYQLIFGSKLPSAIMFQQWVFEQVLPSIRKTGTYSVSGTDMDIKTLKAEVERKKLILENAKLDQQLERLNKSKQADTDISDIQLAKIYRLTERKGEITASSVKKYIRELKETETTKINELLMALVELGKVERIPTNKGFKVKLL